MTGYTYSSGTSDIWLLKLEADGSLANCPFGAATNATVNDTNITGIASEAEMTITTVIPTDTSALPADSTMTSSEICPLSDTQFLLKVAATRKRRGEGSISSLDTLIDCPDVCQAQYNAGVLVTLSATPSPLSTFVEWKPASLACAGSGPCQVTMDKKKSVKAVFQGPNKLKVVTTFKNNAAGMVTSGDALINCPGDCDELYILNAPVTLTATAGSGSTFVKWTGNPCKNEPTNICTFTMDKNATVKAIFQTNPE